MPKKPKISPNQRRDWLARYENGEMQNSIAKSDKVHPRTVREGIEKARTERAYESAQNQQLSKALDLHQQDLLNLFETLKSVVHTPGLTGSSYGMEHNIVLNKTHPIYLNDSVHLNIDDNGPFKVVLNEENSLLYRCLKEHLSKAPVLRYLTEWQRLLLKEQQARYALIKEIILKGETIFKRKVGLGSSKENDIFTSSLVGFVRVEKTRDALGETSQDSSSLLSVTADPKRGHNIAASGINGWLILNSDDPETDKNQIKWLIEHAVKEEAQSAARAYINLQNFTQKTQDELEGFLLMHHVPGQCRLCRKLGGR